jgi:hypothetical protein
MQYSPLLVRSPLAVYNAPSSERSESHPDISNAMIREELLLHLANRYGAIFSIGQLLQEFILELR